MSAAACKAAICNNNAAAAADTITQFVNAGEFDDEQLDALADCADKFVKDVLRIVKDD